MTDIDFDELDKAVSSLMQQHNDKNLQTLPQTEQQEPALSQSALPPNEAASPTVAGLDIPEPEKPKPPVTPLNAPVAEPISTTPPAQSETEVVPVVSSTPPLATKRTSGRFMDVVHPSSDMMNNHPVRPRASRVGVSLQPTTEVTTKVVAESIATPTEAQDHIAVEAASGVSENEPIQPPSVTTDELYVSQPPLESPFVQGAVVDKRPLGGTDIVEDTPETELPVTTDIPIVPIATTPSEQPIETSPEISEGDIREQDAWGAAKSEDQLSAEPLVPELASDLMALETSEPSVVEEVTEVVEQPAQKIEEMKKALPVTPVMGDIPQQYTAELGSEPEPVPMFDAAAQTPELTHKEKKKSGWLTVVLIFLLLIIGGAGGAAVWYFLL